MEHLYTICILDSFQARGSCCAQIPQSCTRYPNLHNLLRNDWMFDCGCKGIRIRFRDADPYFELWPAPFAGSSSPCSVPGIIGASSTSNPLSAVLSTYGNDSIDTTPSALLPVPLAVRESCLDPYLQGFHLSSPTETCRIPPSFAVQCSAIETPIAVHIEPVRRLNSGPP